MNQASTESKLQQVKVQHLELGMYVVGIAQQSHQNEIKRSGHVTSRQQIQEMLGRFFDAMDKVVESHGGRVIDRAGDAVMAVFGAPVGIGVTSTGGIATHTPAAKILGYFGLR